MGFINIFMVISREILEIITFLFLICNALVLVKGYRKYVFLGLLFGILQACLIFFCGINLIERFFDSYDVIITFISGFGMLYTAFWICNQLKYMNKVILPYQALLDEKYVTYNRYYIVFFVGMVIMREVLEILVFTSGIINVYKLDNYSVFIYSGGAIFINVGIGLAGYMLFFRKIIKLIFKVSYYWMICFSANLIAVGFVKLNSIGVINILNFKIWDLSTIIANNSFLGEILNMLVGYNAIPTALGTVIYISVLLVAYINAYVNVDTCVDAKSCKANACTDFKK